MVMDDIFRMGLLLLRGLGHLIPFLLAPFFFLFVFFLLAPSFTGTWTPNPLLIHPLLGHNLGLHQLSYLPKYL